VEHDYLSVDDLSPKELEDLLDLAADVKARPEAYEGRLCDRAMGRVYE
jgi:ornithine carbamoyltransferase